MILLGSLLLLALFADALLLLLLLPLLLAPLLLLALFAGPILLLLPLLLLGPLLLLALFPAALLRLRGSLLPLLLGPGRLRRLIRSTRRLALLPPLGRLFPPLLLCWRPTTLLLVLLPLRLCFFFLLPWLRLGRMAAAQRQNQSGNDRDSFELHCPCLRYNVRSPLGKARRGPKRG